MSRPQVSPFIIDSEGPEGVFAVFEDDGETGYLYLYEPGGAGVSRHLHLYDRSEEVAPGEQDVSIVWSADKRKCGVIIWGSMRGIIDLARNSEGRVWIEKRSTPGIADQAWLEGF